MLPGSDAVKAVYLDPQTGILAGAVSAARANPDAAPEPKLIMECGTIETDTILAVAKAAQETSASDLSGTLTFVDAPVSGGPMFVSFLPFLCPYPFPSPLTPSHASPPTLPYLT